MAKPIENRKARAVWFGLVDMVIILILAGFIASMFLLDGPEGNTGEESPEKLIFSVSVQSPYGEELFLQEGRGGAVSIRLSGSTDYFGRIVHGDDGIFYVECELSAVRLSEDREGLWLLGETLLMTGESISVESELADFTITVTSAPVKAITGSVGTTEPLPETTADPETTTDPADDGEEDAVSTDAETVSEDVATT